MSDLKKDTLVVNRSTYMSSLNALSAFRESLLDNYDAMRLDHERGIDDFSYAMNELVKYIDALSNIYTGFEGSIIFSKSEKDSLN